MYGVVRSVIVWGALASRVVESILVDSDDEAQEISLGGLIDSISTIPARDVILDTTGSKCRCQTNLKTFHKPKLAQPWTMSSKLPACSAASVGGDRPVSRVDECWVGNFGGSEKQECDFIANNPGRMSSCLTRESGSSKPHLFVLGDSISVAWMMAFQKAADSLGFTYRRWSMLACTLGHVNNKVCPSSVCTPFFTKLTETLTQQVTSGDVVAVLLHQAKMETWSDISRDARLSNAREDLIALRNVVSAKNASLLLIGSGHELPIRGSECKVTDKDPQAYKACEKPESKHHDESAFDEWQSLEMGMAAKYPDVKFFKMSELYCQQGACGALIPGTSVLGIYDFNHFTNEGAFYAWPFLCDFLTATFR